MKRIILFFVLCFTSLYASANAHVFYDFASASYIVENNRQEVRPIASITKIITAITVLESGVNLDELVKVNGRSYGFVPNGALMSRMDLMRAMLISSDNRAAEALANHHPGGFLMFVLAANKYLESHALYNTRIVDSSGLLPGNVSTAHELIESDGTSTVLFAANNKLFKLNSSNAVVELTYGGGGSAPTITA